MNNFSVSYFNMAFEMYCKFYNLKLVPHSKVEKVIKMFTIVYIALIDSERNAHNKIDETDFVFISTNEVK